MGLKKFVILIAIISWPLNLFALTDKEIQESKKCSGLFNYFERKYKLPKDLLHSIALQESAKRHTEYKINIVWPWTVNVNGAGYHFPTKKEAIRFTKLKLAEGNDSIDVGCMQINLKYHPDAFTSIEQAFTPIKNVGYGAKFLREKFDANGDWMNAVGHYHSQTKDKSLNYSSSVSRIALNMDNYKDLLKTYAKPVRKRASAREEVGGYNGRQAQIRLNSYSDKKVVPTTQQLSDKLEPSRRSVKSSKAIGGYHSGYRNKSSDAYSRTKAKTRAKSDYYRTVSNDRNHLK